MRKMYQFFLIFISFVVVVVVVTVVVAVVVVAVVVVVFYLFNKLHSKLLMCNTVLSMAAVIMFTPHQMKVHT